MSTEQLAKYIDAVADHAGDAAKFESMCLRTLARMDYRTQPDAHMVALVGPRAPKRKRRKRLAKKIKQRGGMLKTCGIVQSYFGAWPEMRFWWGR